MAVSRRKFMTGALGVVAGPFGFRDDTFCALKRLPAGEGDPEDEEFWKRIRSAFDIDPNLTMFNHAGLSPSPATVRESMERAYRAGNTGPSYVVWRKQENELQPIRERLSTLIGCSPDELILTPNATYGLQTAIMGIPLLHRDELLTTSHDYPRTHTAMEQRERRDDAKPVIVALSVPPEPRAAVAKQILDKVTTKTRLVVLSQMTLYSGNLLPVREVAEGVAARGIPVLADAAHGIGLLPEKLSDLKASMYTACLHKWLMGPVGTGVFVVKRPWIKRLWPLHPADESLDDDIRKFGQIGTHSVAPYLAIREALDFHGMLGIERKAARLEVLRKRLAERVLNSPGVRHYGSLDPAVCRAVLTVGFESRRSSDLAAWLFEKHRIHVTTMTRAGFDAIRISPNIFTTCEEVDNLGKILDAAARGADG